MSKVSNFFSEVRHEISETKWPTAKEMRKNTVSVFTVVTLFAIFFYAAEFVITSLLSLF